VSPRPWHSSKEIEVELRSLDAQGWRVEKGREVFQCISPRLPLATCAIWWDG